MLTPADIAGHEFGGAVFNGYHKGDVDDFLETIAGDYGELYKKNQVLEQKLRILVKKIEEYRQTEENMRSSLLTAQKRGEEIIANSESLSAQLLADADTEIKKRRAECDTLLADEEEKLYRAASETRNFIRSSLEMLERHKDFLTQLSESKSIKYSESQERREAPSAHRQPAKAADTAANTEPVQTKNLSSITQPPNAAEDEEDDDNKNGPFDFESKIPDFDNLKFGYNFSAGEDD